MSAKDDAARVTFLSAIAETVDAELKAAKAAFASAREAEGIKTITASLPSGEAVSTITWVTPGPKAVVTDPAAFLEWVKANRPEHVERRFVSEVRPAFAKALLDEMAAAGVARWCDRETGELHEVPGVVLQGRAAYQRLTFEKTGHAGIAEAWRTGRLQIPGLAPPELPPAAADDSSAA